MGLLVNGIWRDQWYDTTAEAGRFVRPRAKFRNWVTRDGSAGPTGAAGFAAAPGRYHLYVSLACPWAHRTLIMGALKGLEDLVSLSVLHWRMLDRGWTFEGGAGVIPDPVLGAEYLYQIYLAADRSYSGRVTTPVLWDRIERTIVSNESSEIVRMFNSAFDEIGARPGDYYPENLRAEIDALNERIYDTVNDGVYKAGFATTQRAYEDAVVPLFKTLDWIEERLRRQRYLCGEQVTEADIRLLTTLLRFDLVYFAHFKCNARRLADYPNLSGYARDLYQMPGVAATFNVEHTRRHYYESHRTLNPSGIVPVGPAIAFDAPHDRARPGRIGAHGLICVKPALPESFPMAEKGVAVTVPIAAWHTEHVYFNQLLRLLQRQVDVFHSGERPNYELMLDIISYLREYSDQFHHPREDVAFARLAKRCPDLELVLARLGQEHRVIAQAGEQLRKLLLAVLGDAVVQRAEVEMAAATYLVYYGNHIAKEEEDVLPRAAQELTGDDWEAVRRAVPAVRDPLFDGDPAERYRELRRQIAQEA